MQETTAKITVCYFEAEIPNISSNTHKYTDMTILKSEDFYLTTFKSSVVVSKINKYSTIKALLTVFPSSRFSHLCREFLKLCYYGLCVHGHQAAQPDVQLDTQHVVCTQVCVCLKFLINWLLLQEISHDVLKYQEQSKQIHEVSFSLAFRLWQRCCRFPCICYLNFGSWSAVSLRLAESPTVILWFAGSQVYHSVRQRS